MEKHFTHLHLHTDHSLLDGAITIDRLVQFGQEHNLKRLAISDHGNIFGAVAFFDKCKKAGMQPVLGMEAYITQDMQQKTRDTPHYHLLLLVQNQTGYQNLCRLIYYSYTYGFYFKPRIDYQTLREHSEGLIATSTCLGGHIPQLFLAEQDQQAYELIDSMLEIFGDQRYFLEVQPSDGRREQKYVNERILEAAQKKGLLAFASGDCHYPTVDDKYAHEVMLAIQTRAKMTDTNRMSLADCHIHMRTPQEMLDAFPEQPDLVWNSGYIADLCDFDFDKSQLFFPQFTIPQEYSEEGYLRELCSNGLRSIIERGEIPNDADPQTYWDRLETEISLISYMGFVTYFLIVSDFIGWAKENDIPVGPGRGSAAGSLVAWTLNITDIDPIRYNLLFERFLNPERLNMPDIDIDFCMEERERVIDHVREKYGHDKVCQIITFGTMLAKGVVKDVARALGIPFEEANAITEMIPDQTGSLEEALQHEPKLEEKRQSDPRISQLFDIAFRIEGLTRHASKHAAGLVITPRPIYDMLPIYVPSKTNDVVTQYPMNELESLGFLKMDFLGLKNLTLIKRVTKLIKKNYDIDLDPSRLPFDDPEPYKLISAGNTTGVFQLESSGIRDVLRRLKPEAFEDIIAVNALYRPGPLGAGMTEDFIKRRHGEQEASYLLPELEPVLKETHGVILYQEQVMKIASTIADYSLGEADMLRRAMGKKKAKEMAEHRTLFIERATNKGFDQSKAEELFDLMAYFAGYGFNKSHSAAYGKIAYQTAYLKAHYPAEFMASLISLEVDDTEKMGFYLQEVKEMQIEVLPPDINASEFDFTTENGAIRFGLHGIKNLGTAALEHCIQERRENGAFQDILDFCTRVDLRTCNRRAIETLIAAGAFDQLPGNRAQQTKALDQVIDIAVEKKKAAETGQMGLFDMGGNGQETTGSVIPSYTFEDIPEWDDATKLAKEKEMLGVYLSAQPLDSYRPHMRWLQAVSFTQAKEDGGTVICCGSLKQYKEITTKKGDRMAFVTLEDENTTAEIVVFPKVYQSVQQYLDDYAIFVVKGQIDENATTCKIKAQFFMPIDIVFDEWTGIQYVTFTLPTSCTYQTVYDLKSMLISGPTPCYIQFQENNETLVARPKTNVFCDEQSLQQLHNNGVNIQCTLT